MPETCVPSNSSPHFSYFHKDRDAGGQGLAGATHRETLSSAPGSGHEGEAGIKTISKEKKCKKAKWLSEEALQIAEKRREVKGKGEKKRYTHLNAEFKE